VFRAINCALQVKGLHNNKKQKMKKGVVKFFNETKGFGFIKVDGTGE
jgi:hypothetical protein